MGFGCCCIEWMGGFLWGCFFCFGGFLFDGYVWYGKLG